MRIKCLYNTGKDLRTFEYESLFNEVFGRFGASYDSVYGELDIGKEYLVMGILIFNNYQAYVIDDGDLIFTAPCQLFEIIDNKLNENWCYRLINKQEEIYPYVQSIIGYPELCNNKGYEKLLLDTDIEAENTYFERKKTLS